MPWYLSNSSSLNLYAQASKHCVVSAHAIKSMCDSHQYTIETNDFLAIAATAAFLALWLLGSLALGLGVGDGALAALGRTSVCMLFVDSIDKRGYLLFA